MNIAQTRQAIADACSAVLPDDAKVFPYLPNNIKNGTGWVVRGLINTEETTFGELNVKFNVVVAVGTTGGFKEQLADDYAAALFSACQDAGDSVSIDAENFTINGADFHCLIATLSTRVEAS